MASVIEIITNEAAKDLFKRFVRSYVRLDRAVKFGHQRWTYIDKVMLEDEGEEVRDWWVKLSANPPYKSLLRRKIWEKFTALLSAKIRQDSES